MLQDAHQTTTSVGISPPPKITTNKIERARKMERTQNREGFLSNLHWLANHKQLQLSVWFFFCLESQTLLENEMTECGRLTCDKCREWNEDTKAKTCDCMMRAMERIKRDSKWRKAQGLVWKNHVLMSNCSEGLDCHSIMNMLLFLSQQWMESHNVTHEIRAISWAIKSSLSLCCWLHPLLWHPSFFWETGSSLFTLFRPW